MRILNWTDSPEQAIALAVDSLRQGNLVAIPTDTLYGLAADATNDEAVRSLFQAKRRPRSKPLPILVATSSRPARWQQDARISAKVSLSLLARPSDAGPQA